tara:strand:+ start:546 stop:917 length:372 start_codon:yes stop_codon:yes gene_type:complete
MKNLTFLAVMNLHIFVVSVIKNVCLFLLNVSGFLFSAILRVIDIDQFSHGQTVDEQSEELSELNILISIKKVRDNAVKTGHWNTNHQQQLETLGNVLANNFEWEVDQVEKYIYDIIETGPLQE